MMKLGALFLFVAICGHSLKSQDNREPSLVIKTHTYSDGIAIRWTPSNFMLWKKWNATGYRLERQIIEKNGEPVTNGEVLLLGGEHIKPLSDSLWIEYAKTTPEAGLIGSCLKDERKEDGGGKSSLISEIEEANQCYAFCMLAMQQKYELALAAGIGFVDKNTKPEEVYLYKLYPVNASSKDTQWFVIDSKEITKLPRIEPFTASVVEDRIHLRWNGEKYNSEYFGFQIEKSMDSGNTFIPINTIPLIPNYNDEQSSSFEIYSDSISRYYSKILYRIKGMSYFGQYDIPSIPDTVVPYPETSEYPKALSAVISVDSIVQLKWNFDKRSESFIDGFNISISDSLNGDYKLLDFTFIQPNLRRFELTLNKSVSYIKINAISKNGVIHSSFPLMVQIVDSFPPTSPIFVSVSVDSIGIANILWSKNKEPDLYGYKLFRGNSRKTEFSSITSHYLHDTVWKDTLINTMIRDSIYYSVVAFDKRYNQSKHSKIAACAIPNKIPPAPPYIYDFTSNYELVSMKWHPSSSEDVDHYIIQKYNITSNDTTEIYIPKSKNYFRDSQIIEGNMYFYTIKAMDFDGNSSICAKPREVQIPFRQIMPEVVIKAIDSDSTNNRVNIFWNYDHDSAVSHYRILLITSDNKLHTVGTAESGKTFYTYQYLPPLKSNRFKIVAYYKNGRRSKF